MDYKLIEKDSFKVIGKTKRITTLDGENLNLVPLFWKECQADGSYEKICSMAGGMGVFGICLDFEPNYEAFTYMIAVEDNGETPADFSSVEIPTARWAVFESVGPMPGAIQKVWERIYSEWIPATGYQQEEGPQLEFIHWVIYLLRIISVRFGFR
ncbi:GyrI-like domain-containing protein [Desulfosporosinus meridiei]|uniref:AraC effector-binding domain-containing protein n=1 Tax=Desulfosporosinus meridiei (strain ATCC BAA-275 / DSM 13257 / KCTC 12902 / NCIMB 13706 / S10) TaxID=768704 RepID=J7IT92_DESMD|nr:GyrI-like domain-containing protein [Desulfosporosinus meridiei]AFQ45112.1 hypothetical protein Desmer_3232 [Desulfosporosinus meridiei DSM 13257]